eukprot:gene36135-43824_t
MRGATDGFWVVLQLSISFAPGHRNLLQVPSFPKLRHRNNPDVAFFCSEGFRSNFKPGVLVHGHDSRAAMAKSASLVMDRNEDVVWKKAFDQSKRSLSSHFSANPAEFTQAAANMKEVATLVHRNSFLEVRFDVPALGDDSEEAKQLLRNARTQLVAAVKRGAEDGQILKVTLAMPKLGGRVSEVMPLHSSAGQFIGEVPKLDCYILPQGGSDLGSKGLTWPLFSVEDVKQDEALGMSMLFDRCGRADIGRREHTLQALERGSRTAWVGLPGIGKSVASQSVLMGAIRKLGRGPSDIPMVFYRARMKLFVIYLDEDGNVE